MRSMTSPGGGVGSGYEAGLLCFGSSGRDPTACHRDGRPTCSVRRPKHPTPRSSHGKDVVHKR